MITLFVGHNTEHTADPALALDPGSFLIDHANWRKVLARAQQGESFTAYTSLADLPKIDPDISVLWELMEAAHKIIYAPPPQWRYAPKEFSWESAQIMTEYYLRLQIAQGKDVEGMVAPDSPDQRYLGLAARRADPDPVLWISGCSISHGVGVDATERYGHRVGQTLRMPTYYLTEPGSSLEWQADQILRSDIRRSDIVIWGLTQEDRAPLVRDGRIMPWPDDTIEDVEYRLQETRYYKAITSVFQVQNFCAKIGCGLILLPLIASEKLQMDLMGQPCYYQLPYQTRFLDLGSDDLHPGPQQHRAWAEFCLEIL